MDEALSLADGYGYKQNKDILNINSINHKQDANANDVRTLSMNTPYTFSRRFSDFFNGGKCPMCVQVHGITYTARLVVQYENFVLFSDWSSCNTRSIFTSVTLNPAGLTS